MPTFIVTGGAQGIGRVTARKMVEAGHSVAVFDSDAEALRELTEEYRGNDRFLALACDVADENRIKSTLRRVKEEFNGIDGLINNAAISCNGPFRELSKENWDRVLAVNLTAPFLMTKLALPLFRKGRGAVVNICSTRALMSEPNTEAYSASKGGLLALTHALAASLGPDIRVNAVSPGWIETSPEKKSSQRRDPAHSAADHRQHPVGRVGVPDDIAEMVLYLLSEKAGFITGQNFVVDGGMTKKMIYI